MDEIKWTINTCELRINLSRQRDTPLQNNSTEQRVQMRMHFLQQLFVCRPHLKLHRIFCSRIHISFLFAFDAALSCFVQSESSVVTSISKDPSFPMMSSNALDIITRPPLHSEDRAESQVFEDTVDFGSNSAVDVGSLPIDNTTLVYIPVRLPCGVETCCAPEVLSHCPMVLRSLQTDLVQILRILPWSVHSLVKRTKIWVNANYAYGLRDNPRVLRHSTAHHHEGWLIHWYGFF